MKPAVQKKPIEYWGAGFRVKLRDFPAFKEDGIFVPDVPFGLLHKQIAYGVVRKPFLLTGAETAFLRAQAGLNRSEAARRLGVTRRTLINWEQSGDQPIKAPAVSHLGIRILFASLVFPELSLPFRGLAKFEPAPAKTPIEIGFAEFAAAMAPGGPRSRLKGVRRGRPGKDVGRANREIA